MTDDCFHTFTYFQNDEIHDISEGPQKEDNENLKRKNLAKYFTSLACSKVGKCECNANPLEISGRWHKFESIHKKNDQGFLIFVKLCFMENY